MEPRSIIKWQLKRERDQSVGTPIAFERRMQVTDSLIARLGLEVELKVRQG